MHTALEVRVLIEFPSKFPLKFGCLDVWEDEEGKEGKIVVGTNEGALLILSEVEAPPSGSGHDERRSRRFEVVSTLKTFAKKPITQVVVLKEIGLLVSLSDCIHSHELNTFNPVTSLSRTKGASLFNWDEERGYLCVALKRRLLLYHLSGHEFMELRDISLTDTVKSMAWCGDSMCLGFKKEYSLLNIFGNGAISEVFPTGGKGMVNILPLQNQELMLMKDSLGINVGQDGKPTRRHGLPWSEAPLATASVEPYVLAVLPRFIEVRSLQRGPQDSLVQTIPLRDQKFLCSSKSILSRGSPGPPILVANESAIYQLLQVPLAKQIDDLARARSFEEALTLCDMLKESDELKKAKVESLHQQFAYSLFEKNEHPDAMSHFSLANVSPLEVLALFPALLPSTGVEVPPLPSDFHMPYLDHVAYSRSVSSLLSYLLALRQNADLAPQLEVVAASQMSEEAELEKQESSDVHNEEHAKLRGIVDTAILRAMIVPGAVHDGAALKFLHEPNSVDVAQGEETLLKHGRHHELVELYRCNELHWSALSLLQQLAERPHELDPPPPHPSPFTAATTVDYLLLMGAGTKVKRDLVLQFSQWVLVSDAEQGLELMTGIRPRLPLDVALPHVQEFAKDLAVVYLEKELSAHGDTIAPSFHNELVQMYLELVIRERNSQLNWTEETVTPLRKKLLDFLQGPSPRFNPERMLSRFPVDALYKERALLLSRIQRHKSALFIYVHKLNSPKLAEEYCHRVYAQAVAAAQNSEGGENMEAEAIDGEGIGRDVYLALLQVYLEGGTDEYSMGLGSGRSLEAIEGGARASKKAALVQEALGLLSRWHDRIDGERALLLLPGETPLLRLLPFLEGVLRGCSEARRSSAVVKSLRRYEHLQVQEAMIHAHQRVVDISTDRVCAMCNKRISNSVFAVYPGGMIVHYNCYNRAPGNLTPGAKGPPTLS